MVPQGRALEEIDAIFQVPFNPFRPHKIPFTDAERRVGQLEGEKQAATEISEEGDNYTHGNVKDDS
jgi:MFS transporter, SP family, sugar:H+ symporter